MKQIEKSDIFIYITVYRRKPLKGYDLKTS